ncbi:MAG: GMC family oxidoreductase [Alphaproteobacteria bacterium]|nr:GMC family oxidoreductase [Alphaproteobacteria bacterium]
MTALIDARTLAPGTHLQPDLAIIGGGPAGIALALALAGSKLDILLLESGGLNFDPAIQKMYSGAESGVRYAPLDAGRLRQLGGGSNHWGGYCRPMDEIDFEARDWVPHSGWPFSRKALEPYFPRAQALVEAGPWIYDQKGDADNAAEGSVLPLTGGGLYTSWFQFSKMRGDILPTQFGNRYKDDLVRAPNIKPLLHANVTAIRLAPDAKQVTQLDVATLTGKHFTVKPRYTVLACGGIENVRLLLASNDVMKTGIGNQNDLVGRFFADNPIPRDVATLVSFAGPLAPFYGANQTLADGTIMRATFATTARFCRAAKVAGSLSTIEQPVELDETGKAAVITTAIALGVDASNARAYSLGCGMELMPDPERRLTLSGQKDALGLPRLKLDMRIADEDFARFRRTLSELGRQLLASKAGMLKILCNKREDWMTRMDWGHHHLGTTRMSSDPKQGVVDADGLVHGMGNLYIAGSSTFPSYSASNPTLNLLALTLRLGDHLKKVMA